MSQNKRFLPNIVIGDEACFSVDGTVSTYNVRIYAPKGHKPDSTFQRNNSCQEVTIWSGVFGNGVLLGSYFYQRNVNGGN